MMNDVARVTPVGEISPGDYPIPSGWRVLIEPIKVEETTKGGIVLPSKAVEAKEHLRHIGRVVDMGELCYKHGKFQGCKPWCEVGDYVAYGAYSGQEMKVRNSEGTEYVALRLINDDEVLAVIPSPASVMIYC